MINVKVDAAKMQRDLAKKKERATRRANVKKALRPGAVIGLEGARQRVPVDTGRLRDSLKIRVSGNNLLVETREPHAAYNEFKNRSYLRATVEADEKEMVGAIKREYKSIVE